MIQALHLALNPNLIGVAGTGTTRSLALHPSPLDVSTSTDGVGFIDEVFPKDAAARSDGAAPRSARSEIFES